jgi:hypothetical protein
MRQRYGKTQTPYEALLHFGLREIEEMNRLSEFPSDLRALRVIAQRPITREEMAALDGMTVEDDGLDPSTGDSPVADADQALATLPEMEDTSQPVPTRERSATLRRLLRQMWRVLTAGLRARWGKW